MAETLALSKILRIRENEKLDAQKAYQQSMAFFEDIATQLYTLLKKKEVAESSYEIYLQKTIPIDKIKEQITYIESLNGQIINLQADVHKARSEMDSKQVKLTNAHIEVKKFEKIIEFREKSEQEATRKYENTAMDEISIQQYLRKQTGE